jgi:hypothetical protein
MTRRIISYITDILLVFALAVAVVLPGPVTASGASGTKMSARIELTIIRDWRPNQQWIIVELTHGDRVWKFHEVVVLCRWDGAWQVGGSDYTDDLGRAHFRALKHGEKMRCKIVSLPTQTTRRGESRSFLVGTK